MGQLLARPAALGQHPLGANVHFLGQAPADPDRGRDRIGVAAREHSKLPSGRLARTAPKGM